MAKQVHAGAPPHAPLVILANKRSPARLEGSAPQPGEQEARQLTREEVERVVQSSNMSSSGRPVHTVQVNALMGDGMDGAVAWLADKLRGEQ